MDLHTPWFSERNVDMFAFIGDDRLRISVRTVRCVLSEVASASWCASTFADLLRIRRVYKSFSADEQCRNASGLQDGIATSCRPYRKFLVLSQAFEWDPIDTC